MTEPRRARPASRKTQLSIEEARRIALEAQGLASARIERNVTLLQIRRAIERLGLLQIDSVNVLVRAHYLPMFSRLGIYDRVLLERLSTAKPGRFFEYWGHEASLLPIDLHPLFRWRMARARRGVGIWRQLIPFASDRRREADALIARIASDGPIAASDLATVKARKGMWVWSEAKHALEWLFWSGLLAATHRRGNFERVYDLPERVLPKGILDTPTPPDGDAHRQLVDRSARALGVATANDLRDYYRLPANAVQQPIADLVDAQTLVPVRVRGWTQQAYLHKEARSVRTLDAAALLSPFDPLVWHRPRTERLFGFRYRLEIYTPAHKREHGYYVLPFLLNGGLVARVDLKADRQTAKLIVQRAHLEPNAPPETTERLAEELQRMAAWLSLSDVVITPAAQAQIPAAARPALLRGSESNRVRFSDGE